VKGRALILALGLAAFASTSLSASPATAVAPDFSFQFLGKPASPLSVVPAGWDVQIHRRDPTDSMDSTPAQHGPDCSAPPAIHVVTQLSEGVFICNNHLMTAISDAGYGEIALTPDHMVDFAQGTATINVSVSTLQLNRSDWVEVWITPFADNQTLPFEDTDPDLQGPPKNALVFSFNASENFGTNEGDVQRFDNFAGQRLNGSCTVADLNCLSQVLSASAVTRTPYEMDVSQTHIRFGLPALNVWWLDQDIAPLPFKQGVVTLTHHSYNPVKHCPSCGLDTWHWSNFSISNAEPFAIINGDARSVHASGATVVNFAAPAPVNAFLRFSGIGTIQLSYDGGATWVAAQKQSQIGNHEEHFSSYFTPIPAGTQSVAFRGADWYGGPWWVRDSAIWSQSGSSPQPPVATPPPAAASPSQPVSAATSTPNHKQQAGSEVPRRAPAVAGGVAGGSGSADSGNSLTTTNRALAPPVRGTFVIGVFNSRLLWLLIGFALGGTVGAAGLGILVVVRRRPRD
jgi:hypothetical protein